MIRNSTISFRFWFALFLLLAVSPCLPAAGAPAEHYFIENKGQWNEQALFLAHASGIDVWLTRTGLVYDLSAGAQEGGRQHNAVRIDFLGASGQAEGKGVDRLSAFHSYTRAGHSIADVGLFSRAQMSRIYPGIDAIYYFEHGMPRYDLHVQPGASPSSISMSFEGMERIALIDSKTLTVETATGTITQNGLFAYQEINGHRRQVECSFVLDNTYQEKPVVRFALGRYDATQPLVIDPFLYSTYLGGNQDDVAYDIATDAAGNAYITGRTYSPDFPTGSGSHYGNDCDGFVTKIAPDGTLVYSVFLGGTRSEYAYGIVVDRNGNAYVAGETGTPVIDLYSDHIYLTDKNYSANDPDIFVARVSADGKTVSYLARIGGKSDDSAQDIALDSIGNIYITGTTKSDNFPSPSPKPPIGPQHNEDIFLCALDKDGVLLSSAIIGSPQHDYGIALAVDKKGHVYIVGNTQTQGPGNKTNAVLITYDIATQTIPPSLPFGGAQDDWATAVAVDPAGNVYVAGYTGSAGLGTPNAYRKNPAGRLDGFVGQCDPSGTIRSMSYFGGGEDDVINSIAISPSGNILIAGTTESNDILPPPHPPLAGQNDGFVAVLDPALHELIYGEYIGGKGNDEIMAVASGKNDSLSITGFTSSSDFPTRKPIYSGSAGSGLDAFVAHIDYSMPRAVANINTLNFGDVPTGDAKDSSIVITNSGVVPLIITMANVTGGGDFHMLTPLSLLELLPGESTTLTMRFTPQNEDDANSNLEIGISAKGIYRDRILIISLKGKGVKEDSHIKVPKQIDFGDVRVHASQDSKDSFKEISLKITNLDDHALEIMSTTSLHGTDSTDFTLVTPLQSGIRLEYFNSSTTLTFRFRPTVEGKRTTQLYLHIWDTDQLSEIDIPAIELVGYGVLPILDVPDTLDFGEVAVQKDDVIKLHNRSGVPIEITNAILTDTDNFSRDFSSDIMIAPNGDASLGIHFIPQQDSPIFGSVDLKMEGLNAPRKIYLKGTGIGGNRPVTTVALDSLEQAVNTEFHLPIHLENPSAAAPLLGAAGVTGFSASVRYNSTVLMPLNPALQGPVTDGMRTISIQGDWNAQTGGVIAEIPVKTLLGNAEYTVLELTDFVWRDGQGKPVGGQTTKQSGRLHITGIWYDNGVPRLVNPSAGPLSLTVSPNPFSDATTIRVENSTPGTTLKIYDMLGNSVLDLSGSLLTSTMISLKRSDVGVSGMYYCRLTSGEYSLTRVLIVSP